MPISINGSGTITGINAGGLPDGVIQEADLATASVTADKLASNSVTTAKLGSAEQSGLCKAWVNFNGTGTVAIRASYNVSSITDNGIGNYTVNFTTAMVDANYSAPTCCAYTATGAASWMMNIHTLTTSSCRAECRRQDNVVDDPGIIHLAVFR